MPALTCTATRAEVKNASDSTAVMKAASGIALSHAPAGAGSNSGITKYQRNICTSSGMLRNSST